MTTDPIADLIVRLKNASGMGKEHVSVPYSRMKHSIVEVLTREGYVGRAAHKNNALSIPLLYTEGKAAIRGAKRISKPSRRLYMGVRTLRPVKHGHGLMVLSTPAGIVTSKEAKEKRVGGEVLFEIW